MASNFKQTRRNKLRFVFLTGLSLWSPVLGSIDDFSRSQQFWQTESAIFPFPTEQGDRVDGRPNFIRDRPDEQYLHEGKEKAICRFVEFH